MFACGYCRSRSYLLPRKFFRYVLPHSAPENRDLIFFPYWHFKGVLYSCLSSGIQHRFMDVSCQAVESPLFPPSVGLRSQALKMRFATGSGSGRWLKPVQTFEKGLERLSGMYNRSLLPPIYLQDHIGETLSIIYSPFYVDGRLHDAVLNKPSNIRLPDGFDPDTFSREPPDWPIRFIPALCPNCGWDLGGHRNSLVLFCSHCDSAWKPGESGLKKMAFAHIPGKDGTVLYLPFWRIKAEISGISLESYADLVQVANLPRVVRKEWEEMDFYFWTTAFKIRPQDFLRASQIMTLVQPGDSTEREVPKARLHPVTLPVAEAAQSLKIHFAGFAKPANNLWPRLSEIQIRPVSFLLVYIPFEENQHEYLQPRFHLAVNKNALGFAKNL